MAEAALLSVEERCVDIKAKRGKWLPLSRKGWQYDSLFDPVSLIKSFSCFEAIPLIHFYIVFYVTNSHMSQPLLNFILKAAGKTHHIQAYRHISILQIHLSWMFSSFGNLRSVWSSAAGVKHFSWLVLHHIVTLSTTHDYWILSFRV